MKKDKNGIPYNLEVPIYYNVQDGSYILEMDTLLVIYYLDLVEAILLLLLV